MSEAGSGLDYVVCKASSLAEKKGGHLQYSIVAEAINVPLTCPQPLTFQQHDFKLLVHCLRDYLGSDIGLAPPTHRAD